MADTHGSKPVQIFNILREVLGEIGVGDTAYPADQAGTGDGFNLRYIVDAEDLGDWLRRFRDPIQIKDFFIFRPRSGMLRFHCIRHSSPVNERSAFLPAISLGKLRIT